MLIDLMFLPQAMSGAMLTTVDVICIANRLWRHQEPMGTGSLIHWRAVDATGTPIRLRHPLPGGHASDEWLRQPHANPGQSGDKIIPHALVIPPLEASSLPRLREIVLTLDSAHALIASRLAAGNRLAASGTGICLLAAAGVLDGRQAVVPWFHRPWLARTFPGITLLPAGSMSTDNGVICATSFALQAALTIQLLGELGADQVADRLAKMLIPDDRVQETMADMVASGMSFDLGDSIVVRAVQWMRANQEGQIRLDDIADAICTTRRTLQRHFELYVGRTPGDYLACLRMERAKLLLVISDRDIEQIASDCGYLDVRAFRRAFRTRTRMSPSAYRQAQSLRVSKRWRGGDLELAPDD
jgi:transcriptional regulator GlxA family with amidase domain